MSRALPAHTLRRLFLLLLLLLLVLGHDWVGRQAGNALTRIIRERVSDRFGAEIEISEGRVSLLPPSVRLEKVRLRDGSGLDVRTDRLVVRLAVWASIVARSAVIDVALDRPAIEMRGPIPTLPVGAAGSGAGDGNLLRLRGIGIRDGSLRVVWERRGLDLQVENVAIDGSQRGVARPRFDFRARASVRLQRAGKTLEIPRVSVGGNATASSLEVDSLFVRGDVGRLLARGALREGELSGMASWEGELDPAFALIPDAGTVTGGGRIEARIAGSLDEPVIEADLDARTVRIDDVTFSGRGRLLSRGRGWELHDARTAIFGGEVRGTARGEWVPGIPYEVEGRFEDWVPEIFLPLVGVDMPIQGDWDGEARLTGHLIGDDDMAGEGTFRLKEKGRELRGDVRFRVTESTGEVSGRLVEANTRNRLECSYRTQEGRLSGEAFLMAEDLGAFGPFLDLALGGRAEGRAVFEGRQEDPVFRGRVSGRGVIAQGVAAGDVAGPFRIDRTGLHSESASLFGGRLELTGLVALDPAARNDWSASLRSVRLGALVPLAAAIVPDETDLEGSVSGTIAFSGRWTDPGVDARFTVADLVASHSPLGDLTGRISSDAGERKLELRLEGPAAGEVNATLRLAPGGALEGNLRVAEGRLDHIPGGPDGLAGGFTLDADVSGGLKAPEAIGRLRLLSPRLEDTPLPEMDVDLRLAEGRLELMGRSEGLHFEGRLEVIAPHAFSVRADWNALDIGPFVTSLDNVSVRVGGSGELAGDGGTPWKRGRIDFSELTIGPPELQVAADSPVHTEIVNGTLSVPEIHFSGPGQSYRVGGELAVDRASIRIGGSADLLLLEMLVPGVASSRGRTRFDVDLQKEADEPWRANGRAEVEEGTIDLGLLVTVTDLRGSIELEGHRARIGDLTASIGGGDVLVAGTIDQRNGWNLGWAVRDANLGVPEWLDYQVSGNGRLLGDFGRPTLRGEVEVVRAVYDRPIEWQDFLPFLRRRAGDRRMPSEVPLDMDVRLFADGGLFIDNNLAQAELRGDFRVNTSEGEQVRWDGRLEIIDGRFTFRRREFTITAGSADFRRSHPLDPRLQLSGETTVTTREGDYEIAVEVTGSAEDPRIEFLADDPSLTENDVLALVTFGKTVSQLQGQGASIDVAEVIALTPGAGAGRVEALLPVDRIEVQPAYSRSKGSTEPRLTLGKDLAPNLRAEVSSGLGAERGQDVALEYDLTESFSLGGEWESETQSQAGAFGADVRVRIPFRRLRDLVPGSFAGRDP